MHTRCLRNEDDIERTNHFMPSLVFEPQGAAIGQEISSYLVNAEYVAPYLHMLLNCDKGQPYIR